MKRLGSIAALISLAAFAQPPKHWTVTAPASSVSAVIDREVRHGGQASAMVHVRNGGTRPNPQGLVQRVSAAFLLGRRLRLSAYLKSQEARDAVLFFRIDGKSRVLEFATTSEQPLNGTTGWAERALVLDVPDSAVTLSYGVMLSRGRVWIDDVQIERVGHEYTPSRSRPALAPSQTRQAVKNGGALPEHPSNLGFEDN